MLSVESLAIKRLALVSPKWSGTLLTANQNVSATQNVLVTWLASTKNAKILVPMLAVSTLNAEL